MNTATIDRLNAQAFCTAARGTLRYSPPRGQRYTCGDCGWRRLSESELLARAGRVAEQIEFSARRSTGKGSRADSAHYQRGDFHTSAVSTFSCSFVYASVRSHGAKNDRLLGIAWLKSRCSTFISAQPFVGAVGIEPTARACAQLGSAMQA